MAPSLEQLIPLVKTAAAACFGQQSRLRRAYKKDGSLVTQLDKKLQNDIRLKLKQAYPQYPFLGEEMSREDQHRLLESQNSGLWVLDPIDGTTNFSSGFPVYGVALAFVKAGQTQLAVVYDPNRDECFSAAKGEGAWLNGQRLRRSKVADLQQCIANVDYKRLTADVASQLVICPPYRSQRNLGSSVIEWCWLAADRFQVYLHGGQHLWDYAAAQLILLESGGVATGMDGAAISVDKLSKQSVIAAGNPALYQQWFRWLEQQTRVSKQQL